MNFFPSSLPWVKRYAIKAHNLVFHGGWNMPHAIGLEISQACNRSCWYCPQSLDPKKQKIVSCEVWQMFLRRLEEIHWRGIVSFSLYNEPTIVPGYLGYVQELKARLPGCFPILFTNGDRPEIVSRAIDAGVFLALITEHPPYKPLWRYPIEKLQRKHGWHVRVQRVEHPHTQAGRIQGTGFPPFTKCVNSPGALAIDVNGDVLMCNHDYDHHYKHGNILNQSIRDIWYAPAMVNMRRQLARGIPQTKLCHGCFQMPAPEGLD